MLPPPGGVTAAQVAANDAAADAAPPDACSPAEVASLRAAAAAASRAASAGNLSHAIAAANASRAFASARHIANLNMQHRAHDAPGSPGDRPRRAEPQLASGPELGAQGAVLRSK